MSANELETIVAPATPVGRSALAVVRIDGPQAAEIAGKLGASDLLERVATLVMLRDEAGRVDQAVAVRYAAPRSFTGNDLVELTVHGSPVVIDRLLRIVRQLGGRLAQPGEFTERAVLNGKIDLVQAEAIGDLIASRTSLQARVSLENLAGELSRNAEEIRSRLLDVISRLEAALDFADEGYEFISRDRAVAILDESLARVVELAATYGRGRSVASGLTAVILGRPNAGKSTLLNFLCGTDRAIVTAVPGTTRDLLRETVEIGGLPVTLVDTAGIRRSPDAVEEIGIERARAAARDADLVLYLVDAAAGLTAEDRVELDRLPQAIPVFSKIDVAPAPAGELGISVPARQGLAELMSRLDGIVRERFAPPEGSPAVIHERQRQAIEECRDALETARTGLAGGMQEEVVLVDLYRAAGALGALTGAISNAEVMEEIFARFCIGK